MLIPISLSNFEAALILASARILGGVLVARDPLQSLVRSEIYQRIERFTDVTLYTAKSNTYTSCNNMMTRSEALEQRQQFSNLR